MDRDDELMIQLKEEENNNADEDEHLAIIVCLLQQQPNEATNAEPIRGGSSDGRRKTKPRKRMEGHCILYADYFTEVRTFTAKDFRRRFWMNRDLFLRLVHGVREYDTSYF